MLFSIFYCLILFGFLNGNHHRTSVRGYKIIGQSIVFDDTMPSGNRYHLLLKAKKFDAKKHKITWQKVGDAKPFLIVTKIDDHKFYGTDGELPTEAIDTFAFEINGKSILIPRSDYSDLFQPSIWYNNEQRDTYGSGINPYETSDGKILKIVLDFSDGAGYYRAVFKLNREKFLSRQIESGM
jgi:hypothetical protein